jgi:hypothetical protein
METDVTYIKDTGKILLHWGERKGKSSIRRNFVMNISFPV